MDIVDVIFMLIRIGWYLVIFMLSIVLWLYIFEAFGIYKTDVNNKFKIGAIAGAVFSIIYVAMNK